MDIEKESTAVNDTLAVIKEFMDVICNDLSRDSIFMKAPNLCEIVKSGYTESTYRLLRSAEDFFSDNTDALIDECVYRSDTNNFNYEDLDYLYFCDSRNPSMPGTLEEAIK